MPAVITIGESMALMIAEQSGPLEFVTSFTRKVAGAESNVAIGLSRLGHQAGWISSIGDDPFGTYIRNTIRGEGVDTSLVTISPSYRTGMMIKEQSDIGDPKIYYYREKSAASHMNPSALVDSYFDNAKILHITGIFPMLSLECQETVFAAIAIAKKKGLLVVFDPNIRKQLWKGEESRRMLLEIAQQADIILPGIQEAELLVGSLDWKDISAAFHSKGIRFVIMKDGATGAYYSMTDDEIISGYEKGFQVKRVVDTVGAGDGFAVGVLSGILEGLPLNESVRRGNAIGSLAVMVKGDSDGYPTRKELDEYLSR
ncbi:sugar kinase [Pelosinus baikalensis]|uniref:Sugar kinase n=1 Tax=Pelosinus baikalensis TaxID=2892015 RepID=A0ABS8HVP5_9FIRM|nr:sugar kinase [Pelosinus baikalensis]MCC5467225.1 sugar kinase [Pelosinus baikalensis]